MKVIALAVLTVLAACGKDEGGDKFSGTPAAEEDGDPETEAEDAAPGHRSLYVTTVAEKPACTDADEGWLIFVEGVGLEHCKAKAWVAVELPSAPIPEPTRITSSIHCSGELEGLGIYASYSASILSSGDVFASAKVTSGFIQGYGSNYFSAQQNGALTGGITIQDDFYGDPNGGWWEIELNRETLVTSITLHDGDAGANDGNVWSMEPEACIVNDYTGAAAN